MKKNEKLIYLFLIYINLCNIIFSGFIALVSLNILKNLSLMMHLQWDTSHRKVRNGCMKFSHEKITNILHKLKDS